MLTIPFRNKLNTKHIQMDIHGFPFERERGHVCVTKTCVEANLSTTYFLWTIGAAAVVEYSRYPRLCFFVAIIIYERKGEGGREYECGHFLLRTIFVLQHGGIFVFIFVPLKDLLCSTFFDYWCLFCCCYSTEGHLKNT